MFQPFGNGCKGKPLIWSFVKCQLHHTQLLISFTRTIFLLKLDLFSYRYTPTYLKIAHFFLLLSLRREKTSLKQYTITNTILDRKFTCWRLDCYYSNPAISTTFLWSYHLLYIYGVCEFNIYLVHIGDGKANPRNPNPRNPIGLDGRYVLAQNEGISGLARMSKLRGHSMGTFRVCNMHLLGEMVHTPAMKGFLIIHPEITSEAIPSHKYHSCSLTCMLASRPHGNDHTK